MYVNAHEITVAEARAVSICCSRASKSVEKVLQSRRSTLDLNDHVCASLLLSLMLAPSTWNEADFTSLAANIELSEKFVSEHYCAFKACNIMVE